MNKTQAYRASAAATAAVRAYRRAKARKDDQQRQAAAESAKNAMKQMLEQVKRWQSGEQVAALAVDKIAGRLSWYGSLGSPLEGAALQNARRALNLAEALDNALWRNKEKVPQLVKLLGQALQKAIAS